MLVLRTDFHVAGIVQQTQRTTKVELRKCKRQITRADDHQEVYVGVLVSYNLAVVVALYVY